MESGQESIYRKTAHIWTSVVGLHTGKIVDLLENNTPLDLKDKKGDPISAKMKMGLFRVSESDSNVKMFMEKVDADISRLPSNKAVINTASTVGKALQLTKNIMDNLSHVRHKCPTLICTQAHRKSVTRHTRYSKHHGLCCPAFTRLYRRRISRMIPFEN
ncbi:hypothetical protein BDZ97DRAFT_1832491 [Flammula alnicola]|nr:hypothetical protein BDZ97DRAFT_1832491 [Flammula alnicola]